MSELELDQVKYMFTAYSRAGEQWDGFRRSADSEMLASAAGILCQGLGDIEADGSFWEQLPRIAAASDEERGEVEARLRDVDGFLAHHYEILSAIESEAFAARLLGDLTLAIDLVQEWPDEQAFQNLRNRLVDLREDVCRAAEPSPGDERRRQRHFLRGISAVARGIMFGAGAALCAADLVTAHGVIHVAPSIIVGSGAMDRATSKKG